MLRLLAVSVVLAGTTLSACGPERDRDADRPPASSDAVAQRLDAEQVPAELRHLVPLAERWGIGDDVERIQKVDRATPGEREELRSALEPHHAQITAWLDSFGQGEMPEEAAAFMYMQLALEEMRAGAPR